MRCIKVSLVDLDHAAVPEILVSLGGREQSDDWVFKWSGAGLVSISPSEASFGGGPCALLRDAAFVDLDGDGILEVISAPGYSTAPGSIEKPRIYDMYKLVDGAYARSGSFEHFSLHGPLEPHHAPDRFLIRTFLATSPGSPYVMTLASGDGRDEPPVEKTEVRLNGELVPGVEKIGHKVRHLSIPVTVKGTNAIEVTVRGVEGSKLYVGIGPALAGSHPPNGQ